jgi:type I restriction enzyme S subunit
MKNENNNLQKLPKGWVCTRLGEICLNEKNKGIEGSIPYLEIGNIDILTKKYFFEEKPAVKGALISRKGDILISRVRPTRGAVTITQEKELHISSALTVLRPLLMMPSEYMHYFLAWNRTFLDFLGENSTGTMYPTIKEDFILEYPIPIPSLPEQHQIVSEIERRFSVADEVEKVVEQSLKQAERLRHSILKKAFEGKLVPQNPEDEPAEKLLERIRLEKQIDGQNIKFRRRKNYEQKT